MSALRGRILALVLLITPWGAGCAAPGAERAASHQAFGPEESFSFEGHEYRLKSVQDEFVLVRLLPEGGEPGEMSGWMDEIVRLSRYELGGGRWHLEGDLDGVFLQWKGGETFSLVRKWRKGDDPRAASIR